jgi:hypothetical protein
MYVNSNTLIHVKAIKQASLLQPEMNNFIGLAFWLKKTFFFLKEAKTEALGHSA